MAQAGGFATLAVVLTWPTVGRMASRIPIGNEPAATVPRFNLWTMEWNARGLGLLRSGYWDAPIFSPTRGTFAFSDPQPLTGTVFHVLVLVGIGATVAYSLVLLGALTLNGIAAAQLLTDVGAAFVPASLGGALMVALPFVANELGVVQLSMLWPMLFALGALHRYFGRPSYGRAVAIGVWVVVALFTSEYYAFFLIVGLLVVTLVYVIRRRLHLAHLGHAAAALGAIVVLAGPFVAAQSSRVADYEWPEETVASLGANARDWFHLQARSVGSVVPFIGDSHGTQLALFPGVMLLLLAYFGLAGARRSQIRWIIAMLVLGITGAVLAYGLSLHLFGTQPYALLRDHIAGFARIRSPFRWAVLTQMCIALLAGLGLDAVWRWHRRWGPVLAVAFAVLAVVEVAQLPARTATAIRGEHDDWIGYLDAQPSEPIAMVPFPPGPTEVDYTGTTMSMLLGLDLEQPMVNGYSGFFPSDYVELRKQMRDFPNDDTVAALRSFDVRWIVVENAWLTPGRRARMVSLGFAPRPAFAGHDRSVYAMPR